MNNVSATADFLYLDTGERYHNVSIFFTAKFLIVKTDPNDTFELWLPYKRVREIRGVKVPEVATA